MQRLLSVCLSVYVSICQSVKHVPYLMIDLSLILTWRPRRPRRRSSDVDVRLPTLAASTSSDTPVRLSSSFSIFGKSAALSPHVMPSTPTSSTTNTALLSSLSPPTDSITCRAWPAVTPRHTNSLQLSLLASWQASWQPRRLDSVSLPKTTGKRLGRFARMDASHSCASAGGNSTSALHTVTRTTKLLNDSRDTKSLNAASYTGGWSRLAGAMVQ
mmetsp:Transcript_21667/g.61656  ORF Transcript_21667/g.61656 Transcript_21667/m.61656 type:complete len:215 (-) Transcript_21667:354-998(-)